MTDNLLLKQDIDSRLPTKSYHSYINTKLNPADLISRGQIQDLIDLLRMAGYASSNIEFVNLDTPEWMQRIDTKPLSERFIQTTRDMQDPNKSTDLW